MTETPRPPGPWDTRSDSRPAAPQTHAPPTRAPQTHAPARADEPPLDKGQHPVIAIGGTLLFAAFIWFITGSWVIATAVIWGLLVHEYGHVLAMNRLGMGPARIYIIPFLGGVAKSQRLPRSEWDGVIVSMAGPLFGLLATLPFFALYLVLRDEIWLIGAFLIAMINVINLAPAPPLDGSKAIGPVLARISPWLEKAVMLAIGATVVVWALTRGSYIFGIFLALALFGHLSRGIRPEYGRPLTNGESVKSVGLFLVTTAACVGTALTAVTLPTGDTMVGLQQVMGYFGFGR